MVNKRSERERERRFIIEGATLLREALAAGAPIEGVYAPAGAQPELLDAAREGGIDVHRVSPGVVERVADTATPQPLLAVVGILDGPLDGLRAADFLLVCVDVRDPGNAGTILRSAEAAGAGGVVCCDGSVDLFNPKAVRASAGAIFHVPVVVGGEPVEVLEQIGAWQVQRLATVPAGGTVYTDVDLRTAVAFVLGNEAHGLPAELDAMVDEQVTIPMGGRGESLNVGMAATVLCFEVARQRRGRGV